MIIRGLQLIVNAAGNLIFRDPLDTYFRELRDKENVIKPEQPTLYDAVVAGTFAEINVCQSDLDCYDGLVYGGFLCSNQSR